MPQTETPCFRKVDFSKEIGRTFKIGIVDRHSHNRLRYLYLKVKNMSDDGFLEFDSFCTERSEKYITTYSDLGVVKLGSQMFPERKEPDMTVTGVQIIGEVAKIQDITNHLEDHPFLPFLYEQPPN